MTGALASLFIEDQQLCIAAHHDLVAVLVLDEIGILELDGATNRSLDI